MPEFKLVAPAMAAIRAESAYYCGALAIRKHENPIWLGQLSGVEPNALFREQIQFAAQGGSVTPAYKTARRQV